MEITQKSKLTNEEINNIIELLRSPDNNNRQLGIVLALSQDMDIEELVDGMLNKCWFWDDWKNGVYYEYDSPGGSPDYNLGLCQANLHDDPTGMTCEYSDVRFDDIKISSNIGKHKAIYQLIYHFIESEHPHLLSKIRPFETLKF